MVEYIILCLLHFVLVMCDTVQSDDVTSSMTDPPPSLSLSSSLRRVLLPVPIIILTALTPSPPLYDGGEQF